MIFDNDFLNQLTALAKENPRLRQNYDLRNSAEDKSQRMLNAIEPGTIMPIHRHRGSSETVVLLRGSMRQNFYDDQGHLTNSWILKPGTDCVRGAIFLQDSGIIWNAWKAERCFLRQKMVHGNLCKKMISWILNNNVNKKN